VFILENKAPSQTVLIHPTRQCPFRQSPFCKIQQGSYYSFRQFTSIYSITFQEVSVTDEKGLSQLACPREWMKYEEGSE
jgi:hypothetical protein